MSISISVTLTDASDGSPLSGIVITDATQQATQLAVTDESGAATCTLDADVLTANTATGGVNVTTSGGMGTVFGSLIIGYSKNPNQ
jgi:hypothetical protein